MKNKSSGNLLYKIALTVVILSAAGLLLFSYDVSIPWSSSFPILGKDPITEIGIIEDHKFALSRWIEKGIDGAVLINIDAHDDFKKIADHRIKSLQAAIQNNSLPDSVSPYFSEGNFIYAAAKLGVVSEVYWVVPTAFFREADRHEEFQALMAYHRFQPDETSAFSFINNMYSGVLYGIPIHICEISALPTIMKPVLLSIDSDYGPVLATNYDERLIEANARVFKALSDKRYKIRDAVVAYSVNGGHLNSHHRWIADMAIDYLRDPDLMQNNVFPGKYLTLQTAERLHKMQRYADLMSYLFPILEKDIYNPTILIYMAHALDGLGMKAQSISCAEKACLNDENYCYGLCELGCKSLQENGLESAEEYFLRAYKGNPDMVHSQFKYARVLQRAGRYDEALAYFNSFRSYYGPLPVDFYIGETYMLKGDKVMALLHYNNGRRGLAEDPYLWTSFGDRGLIEDIIRFYEQNGHDNHADELRVALETAEQYYPKGLMN